MIRGKTAEEALALRHDELTGDLGALPPMKIHCAQLVEGALKSALASDESKVESEPENIPSLMDSLNKNAQPAQGRLRMLKKEN